MKNIENASNQSGIVVEIRPGSGKAAYFADVSYMLSGRVVKIPGWPVWHGKNGELEPKVPSKLGTKDPSKRFATVELDPVTLTETFQEILTACQTDREQNGIG